MKKWTQKEKQALRNLQKKIVSRKNKEPYKVEVPKEFTDSVKKIEDTIEKSSLSLNIFSVFAKSVLNEVKGIAENVQKKDIVIPEYPKEIKAVIKNPITLDEKSITRFPDIPQVKFPSVQKVQDITEIAKRTDVSRDSKGDIVQVVETYSSFRIIYDIERNTDGDIVSVITTRR